MECPVCQKEFDPHTGRRPKKFCSDECKVVFHNAQKKVKESRKSENKAAIEKERRLGPKIGETHKYPLTEKEVVKAPKTLDQLKALCPHPVNSDERRIWVSAERQKYGI